MGTTAFSTDNVKRRLAQAWFEGSNQNVAVANQDWTMCFDWRYDKNVAGILAAAMTGIPDYSEWNKSDTLSPQAIAALDAKTVTYVAYAATVNFDPFTPDEIPDYEASVMRKLGFSAAATINEAAAGVKADAFTTNSVHGSKHLFATNHEMVGGTRGNLVTSATFDRAAYLSARNGMITWKNYQGQNYDLSGAGLCVEYHPDNDEAVKQAILSRVTSDQGQVNIAADDAVTFIRNPYYDETDDVVVCTKVEGERRGEPGNAWRRVSTRRRRTAAPSARRPSSSATPSSPRARPTAHSASAPTDAGGRPRWRWSCSRTRPR